MHTDEPPTLGCGVKRNKEEGAKPATVSEHLIPKVSFINLARGSMVILSSVINQV